MRKVYNQIRYNENMRLGEGVQGVVYEGEWNPTGFKENHDSE